MRKLIALTVLAFALFTALAFATPQTQSTLPAGTVGTYTFHAYALNITVGYIPCSATPYLARMSKGSQRNYDTFGTSVDDLAANIASAWGAPMLTETARDVLAQDALTYFC